MNLKSLCTYREESESFTPLTVLGAMVIRPVIRWILLWTRGDVRLGSKGRALKS
jgi:hypothetical protein